MGKKKVEREMRGWVQDFQVVVAFSQQYRGTNVVSGTTWCCCRDDTASDQGGPVVESAVVAVSAMLPAERADRNWRGCLVIGVLFWYSASERC